MPDQESERAQLEQAIEAANLRPYQAMVVRTIYTGENVTAALDWIERLREVSDADR